MSQANYMHLLSDEESANFNRDLLVWIKKALKGKHGIYLFNILAQIRSFITEVDKNSGPVA